MKRTVGLSSITILIALIAFGSYLMAKADDVVPGKVRWASPDESQVQWVAMRSLSGSARLVKEKAGWALNLGGYELQADPEQVKVLFSLLSASSVNVVGSTDVSTESYGFLPQSPRFEFGMVKSNAAVVVELGGVDSGSGRVYAKSSEAPGIVFSISERLAKMLDNPCSSFAEKRIMQFDPTKVTHVAFESAAGNWKVRSSGGGWQFDEPERLAGEVVATDLIVNMLHDLRGLRTLSLQLSSGDTRDSSEMAFKVWVSGTAEPIRMDLYTSANNGTYYGTSSMQPMPFVIVRKDIEPLVLGTFDLRGRTVPQLPPGEIGEIVVAFGEKKHILEKTGDGWIDKKEKKAVTGIDMSLWRLKDLRFEATPRQTLPETARRIMALEFFVKGGDLLGKYTFYSDPELQDGRAWLCTDNGTYYPVSRKIVQDVQGLFPGNR